MNGVIVGDKVTLTILFESEGINKYSIEGVLADDCLSGTYEVGNLNGNFSVDQVKGSTQTTFRYD